VRPQAIDIAVPPFPPQLRWLGDEPPPVERICAVGPLLVHFIDAAHASSVQTLPYLASWNERYAKHGLTVLGVNSPRFPFTGEEAKLGAALERLRVGFPVALDRDYLAWHDYGCEGWPSLFLWGRGGGLRWFHFGEGEYAGTEAVIQEELRALSPAPDLPDPMPPRRPTDAPDTLVARPSEELLPGGSVSEPWLPSGPENVLDLDYEAGGAWASVDGQGDICVSIDGGARRTVAVNAPGAYELSAHERHERHALSVRATGDLAVYAISFTAGLPAAGP
jgi:hypothetical protein